MTQTLRIVISLGYSIVPTISVLGWTRWHKRKPGCYYDRSHNSSSRLSTSYDCGFQCGGDCEAKLTWTLGHHLEVGG